GGMAFVTQQAGHPVPVEQVAEKGPSLAFVAFPYALAQLPYSAWFSFVFFFALVTLGIDSGFSLTESIVASIVDKTGWKRNTVLVAVSVIGFGCGLVYITEGGLNWVDTVDGMVNGTWGIAFMGLLECVLLSWMWRVGILRRHANSRSDWMLGKWWEYLLRLVIPVVLGTLFCWQLFDDLNREQFLRTADGTWIIYNCVGMGIVVVVPVLAVILTIVRGRPDVESPVRPEAHLPRRGGRTGWYALAVSVGLAVLFLAGRPLFEGAWSALAWVGIVAGTAVMLVSNTLMERHDTRESQVSWPVRWAGLIASMDVSAFLAVFLVGLTRGVEPAEHAVVIRDELSGTSYAIVGVVCLIIVGGLGWCFYRALAAAGKDTDVQLPDQQ
ncbi:MAG TPA: hypothetical protein ENN81_03180, partial [Phycisphaerales bacterium]|nr:hypothetical protein [Phycisphaerales bacterium]